MIGRIALVTLQRQALPLALHAVALGLAIFFLGLTLTITGKVGEPMVLGARCPDGARELQVHRAGQADNVRAVLSTAQSFSITTLREVRIEPTTGHRFANVHLYGPGLFEAMCFDRSEGRAPVADADVPEAFAHSGYPWLDVAVGSTTQVGQARFAVVGTHSGFHGLGFGGPALWIPERYATLLGVPSPDANLALWLVPRDGASWPSVDRELAALAKAHPAYFDEGYSVLLADGRSPENLATSQRGVVLMLMLATGIAVAVVINLMTYFASRQPAFTELAGILHMLGAPLLRQYALALTDPLALTAGAIATALVCHRMLAQRLDDVFGDPALLSGALVVYFAAALTVAMLLAGLRSHHVLRSGRAGVASARRWSARLYPVFLGAQVTAAAVIVAIAALSMLHWNRVRPGQFAFNLQNTWFVDFESDRQAPDPDATMDRFVAAQLAAEGGGEFELAFATRATPLVQTGMRSDVSREAPDNPDDLFASVVYATDNWLTLIGIDAIAVDQGLATEGRDAAIVNRRFMTARWPEGAPAYPYLTRPHAPAPRTLQAAASPREEAAPASGDDVLSIRAVFSEKDAQRSDRDDLVQPTAILPLARNPNANPTRMSALVHTREPRTADWVRDRMAETERLIGLQVRTVRTAQSVVDDGVVREREQAKTFAQLATSTLIVVLSGMMALCAAMAIAMRRELATRYGLGWSRQAVVRLLARRLAMPIATGGLIGLALGAFATSLMAAQTAGLRDLRWSALLLTGGVVLLIAVFAGAAPIRQVIKARFAEWVREE